MLLLLGELELLEHLLHLLVLQHPVEDYARVDHQTNQKQARQSHSPVEPSVLRGQLHTDLGQQDELGVVAGVLDEQNGFLEERFAEVKRVVDVLVVAVGVVHAGGQEGRVLIDQCNARIGGKGAVVVDPGLIALQSLGRLIIEEDEMVANGGARRVLVDIECGQNGRLAEIFIVPCGQRYGELSHGVALDGDCLRRHVHKFLL